MQNVGVRKQSSVDFHLQSSDRLEHAHHTPKMIVLPKISWFKSNLNFSIFIEKQTIKTEFKNFTKGRTQWWWIVTKVVSLPLSRQIAICLKVHQLSLSMSGPRTRTLWKVFVRKGNTEFSLMALERDKTNENILVKTETLFHFKSSIHMESATVNFLNISNWSPSYRKHLISINWIYKYLLCYWIFKYLYLLWF